MRYISIVEDPMIFFELVLGDQNIQKVAIFNGDCFGRSVTSSEI